MPQKTPSMPLLCSTCCPPTRTHQGTSATAPSSSTVLAAARPGDTTASSQGVFEAGRSLRCPRTGCRLRFNAPGLGWSYRRNIRAGI